MRSAANALRKIRNKIEAVYATGNQEYINRTLPDLIALWMLTVEEASIHDDDVSCRHNKDDIGQELKREDYEYMLRLLDISIAHLENEAPDTIHTPSYVGPDRRQPHPFVSTVVAELGSKKKRRRTN
ncbi:MAG TPA: hypothetical protein P5244_08980 [Syntrophales bacterium]|nr:hypothetical protein [Syntrophales bacterium]